MRGRGLPVLCAVSNDLWGGGGGGVKGGEEPIGCGVGAGVRKIDEPIGCGVEERGRGLRRGQG